MRAVAFGFLMSVAGCSSAGVGDIDDTTNVSLASTSIDTDAFTVSNNATTGFEPGWASVSPALMFDTNSPARALPRPAVLAGATFGYFSDSVMMRQYSPAQLAQMTADHAGFAMTHDLDRDGIAETYRTGFWRIADPKSGEAREGSFLAVFDPGRAPQVIDSSSDVGTGVFISDQSAGLIVADCNCRFGGTIRYEGKRLTVAWNAD